MGPAARCRRRSRRASPTVSISRLRRRRPRLTSQLRLPPRTGSKSATATGLYTIFSIGGERPRIGESEMNSDDTTGETPSPRPGEGWGEGLLTIDRPQPLTRLASLGDLLSRATGSAGVIRKKEE